MLPPLALAAALGLRGPPGRLLVPMGLSAGGNTVTLGRAAAEAVQTAPVASDALAAGRRFGTWLRAQSAPPRFAVVHAFSTHNLLLRYWLAASGLDPDRDISTVVIPPEQIEPALAEGRIAGFCAGAPWGEHAAQRGSGQVCTRHLGNLGRPSGKVPGGCRSMGGGKSRTLPGPVARPACGAAPMRAAGSKRVDRFIAGRTADGAANRGQSRLPPGRSGCGADPLPRRRSMVSLAFAGRMVPGPDAPLGLAGSPISRSSRPPRACTVLICWLPPRRLRGCPGPPGSARAKALTTQTGPRRDCLCR